MPEISLYCSGLWLPTAEAADRPDCFDRLTSQQKITWQLILVLCGFAVEAINEYDGSAIELGEAFVMPKLTHPWAVNAEDWFVLIMPGEIKASFEGRERRRYAISDKVRRDIMGFLTHKSPRPRFDVDCRPISGSGMTVDDRGRVEHTWGRPAPSSPPHRD